MEAIVSSYENLLSSPQPLTSFLGYLQACAALFLLGMLLSWPIAILLARMLSRETLGTSNRVRFAVIWTAIILGSAGLLAVGTFLVLDRVSDWTAVEPHVTFSLVMGVIAIVGFLRARSDLRLYRAYVDSAKQQIV